LQRAERLWRLLVSWRHLDTHSPSRVRT
jgi:hypothetical protein